MVICMWCRLHADRIVDLCQQGGTQFHEFYGCNLDSVDEIIVLLLHIVLLLCLGYPTVQIIPVQIIVIDNQREQRFGRQTGSCRQCSI